MPLQLVYWLFFLALVVLTIILLWPMTGNLWHVAREITVIVLFAIIGYSRFGSMIKS